MKIEVDTHTHTVLSGHAYGTLKENAQAARECGLRGFVTADHGPLIPGAGPEFVLSGVLPNIPDYIEGVRMIRGTEADIIDFEGTLDIGDSYLRRTEFGIASLHGATYTSGTTSQNTDAVLGAMHNPWIDAIGHPGNPAYPIDQDAFVLEAKKLGKPVEINNHSFRARGGSKGPCTNIVRLCKKHEVSIVVSSDAHSPYNVGEVGDVLALLDAEQFPEELVLNATLDRLLRYIERRCERGKD